MVHSYRRTTLFSLSVFVLLALSLTASAQSTEPGNPYRTEGIGGDEVLGDFVVGPGKVDLTLNPGETRTIEILVTNRTGERRIFNLSSEDAAGSRDQSVALQLLGDQRGPYSIRDYISVPAKSFVLEQNQRAHIPVTISVPLDAEPGGLYGSLIVDTVAIDAVAGDAAAGTVPQSAIVARVGTLFFVTIPGALEHDAALTEFGTLQKHKFYQSGPVTFGILHENKGSVHVAPYGELRIRNFFGEEVGYVELDPWFVLPNSVRLREVTWTRDYLFGRYTAVVEINRGYDDVIDEAHYTFWVLPWKPIALAFTGLFVVIFLIRSFLKRFEFKRRD